MILDMFGLISIFICFPLDLHKTRVDLELYVTFTWKLKVNVRNYIKTKIYTSFRNGEESEHQRELCLSVSERV